MIQDVGFLALNDFKTLPLIVLSINSNFSIYEIGFKLTSVILSIASQL